MSTEISNLALRHLGNSNEIANFSTERSQEARAARAFYSIMLATLFREALWPFARKFQIGQLVATNLTSEWLYTYRYPQNCAFFRGIVLPGYVEQSIVTPSGYFIPYIESSDNAGLTILTNLPNAMFCFTRNDVPINMWPADFAMAASYLLASLMAPSITGGDPYKLGVTCLQKYELVLAKAKVAAFNEEATREELPASEFETSRY